MSEEARLTAEVEALMALDLEYRLTIAYRIACDCAPYFAQRREVLMPEVLRLASERGEDPVDVFADFARKVHAQKCGTVTARRFAALMASVIDEPTPPAHPQGHETGASA